MDVQTVIETIGEVRQRHSARQAHELLVIQEFFQLLDRRGIDI